MDAQIRSSSGKEKKVSIELRALSASERKKAALKGLFVCWGLAILFLPLPPIHWVATPLFFLAGFYWSIKKYKEEIHVQPFEFHCPECEKLVPITEQSIKNPKEITCPSCRYFLKLSW